MTSPKTSSSASASSLSQRSNSGWYRTSTYMQFSTYAVKPIRPPSCSRFAHELRRQQRIACSHLNADIGRVAIRSITEHAATRRGVASVPYGSEGRGFESLRATPPSAPTSQQVRALLGLTACLDRVGRAHGCSQPVRRTLVAFRFRGALFAPGGRDARKRQTERPHVDVRRRRGPRSGDRSSPAAFEGRFRDPPGG